MRLAGPRLGDKRGKRPSALIRQCPATEHNRGPQPTPATNTTLARLTLKRLVRQHRQPLRFRHVDLPRIEGTEDQRNVLGFLAQLEGRRHMNRGIAP